MTVAFTEAVKEQPVGQEEARSQGKRECTWTGKRTTEKPPLT